MDVACDLFQEAQRVSVRVKKQASSIESGTLPTDDVAAGEKIVPKVRSITKKAIFGIEWEIFMKERIRGDKELNLRIVRYEVRCVHSGSFQ